MAKIEPIKEEEMAQECATGHSPNYPYGTSMSFEGDLAEELGVSNLKAGDMVEVRGFAFVKRKAEETSDSVDDGEKNEKEMSIQFTEVKLIKPNIDIVEQMYPTKE